MSQHPGVFLRLPRRDARVVLTGVLSVLLSATVVAQATAPETRLLSFVRKLPPAVRVAVLGSTDPSARSLLESLFLLPRGTDFPTRRPVAVLLVAREDNDALAPVALLEPAAAARAGLAGVPLGGFTAVGDLEALQELRAEADGPTVTPSVLRFLSGARGQRVVIQQRWLLAKLKNLERLLGAGAATPDAAASKDAQRPDADGSQAYLAVDVEGDSRRFRLRSLVPGDYAELAARSAPLLRAPPENAMVVLDGLPTAWVFPTDLPPILDALRRESGVGEELAAVAAQVQAEPLLLAVRSGAATLPEVVLGVGRPAGPAGAALEASVRALLDRRLTIAGAVTERVRVGEAVIRHQRRSLKAAVVLDEREGEWRILTARGAARQSDLIAALHDQVILLGSSRDGIRALMAEVAVKRRAESAWSRPSGRLARSLPAWHRRGPNVEVFLDAARLRRLPLTALAVRGIPENLRRWADALDTLRLELKGDRDGLLLTAFGELQL